MPTKNYEACIKIRKSDPYPGKEAGTQIACERNQTSDLTEKDFKIAIINLTEQKKKKRMRKKVKERQCHIRQYK